LRPHHPHRKPGHDRPPVGRGERQDDWSTDEASGPGRPCGVRAVRADDFDINRRKCHAVLAYAGPDHWLAHAHWEIGPGSDRDETGARSRQRARPGRHRMAEAPKRAGAAMVLEAVPVSLSDESAVCIAAPPAS